MGACLVCPVLNAALGRDWGSVSLGGSQVSSFKVSCLFFFLPCTHPLHPRQLYKFPQNLDSPPLVLVVQRFPLDPACPFMVGEGLLWDFFPCLDSAIWAMEVLVMLTQSGHCEAELENAVSALLLIPEPAHWKLSGNGSYFYHPHLSPSRNQGKFLFIFKYPSHPLGCTVTATQIPAADYHSQAKFITWKNNFKCKCVNKYSAAYFQMWNYFPCFSIIECLRSYPRVPLWRPSLNTAMSSPIPVNDEKVKLECRKT